MPDLVEQMYCSQQIVIPPSFPYILKRFCKAAIKTQPYDLLRWSFEYFKALAERRPPPVKLRLEYPIYSTEGGLTRGYLKVLANQLIGMEDVPMPILKNAWQGFCLDQHELNRVLCLCEVFMRNDAVPFLHFIAVAGGLLTKSLTHTMILLCETLTKEPDGGSAAIPLEDFLTMYDFLAEMDASKDIQYHNGFREGHAPEAEEMAEEDETYTTIATEQSDTSDDYWYESDLQKLSLINDHVARTTRLSVRLNLPVIGEIERSPSIERDKELERENFARDWKGRSTASLEIDESLRKIASEKMGEEALKEEEKTEDKPEEIEAEQMEINEQAEEIFEPVEERHVSLTSAEVIASDIKNQIVEQMNAEIALIPDPDMMRKEADEEEIQMIQDMVHEYFDDNMEVIVPEAEEELDQGPPIPVITQVFAVPGIGPPVESDIIREFKDYAVEVAKVQAEVFRPRNIRHFMCPPLEKYEEYDYEHMQTKKEELATGGVITD